MTSKKYTFGVWGVTAIIVLKLSILIYFFFTLRKLSLSVRFLPVSLFNVVEITMLFILLAEAMGYWLLRYRIYKKLWVQLHVWLLFFVAVVMPVLIIFVFTISARYFDTSDFNAFKNNLNKLRFYLSWALTITGHGFFALTVVKSVGKKNSIAAPEEHDGILEEFSNE